MVTLNFPDAPTDGEVFSSGERTWRWDSASSCWVAADQDGYLRLDGTSEMAGDLKMGGNTIKAVEAIELQANAAVGTTDETGYTLFGSSAGPSILMYGSAHDVIPDVLAIRSSGAVNRIVIDSDTTRFADKDGAGIATVEADGPDIVNRLTVITAEKGDNRYLELSGGDMTGFLTLHADPTVDLHAATKGYVDTQITSHGHDYIETTAGIAESPLSIYANENTRVGALHAYADVDETTALNVGLAGVNSGGYMKWINSLRWTVANEMWSIGEWSTTSEVMTRGMTQGEFAPLSHVADTNNPHSVTAAQTGAAPLAHTHVEADITDLDRMRYRGFWVGTTASKKSDQWIDGEYVGIANKDTSDRPAPQEVGDSVWIYDGASPTGTITAKTLLVSNTYTIPSPLIVVSYRVYTITDNVYSIYLRNNDNGVSTQLISFTASDTGWQVFSTQGSLIGAGVSFTLGVYVTEPDPVPVAYVLSYDYTTPNNTGTPATGTIIHADRALGSLRANKTDQTGDQWQGGAGPLGQMLPGDTIEGAGVTWAIQAVTEESTYINFSVAPAQQSSPDGVQNFTLETVTASPISTVLDPDYYLSRPNTQPSYSIDGSAAVLTDDGYGIDIEYQEMTVSDDFDLLPLGSGGSGSSGGEGASTFLTLTDTPTVYPTALDPAYPDEMDGVQVSPASDALVFVPGGFLPRTGGRMSGDLDMSGMTVNDLQRLNMSLNANIRSTDETGYLSFGNLGADIVLFGGSHPSFPGIGTLRTVDNDNRLRWGGYEADGTTPSKTQFYDTGTNVAAQITSVGATLTSLDLLTFGAANAEYATIKSAADAQAAADDAQETADDAFDLAAHAIPDQPEQVRVTHHAAMAAKRVLMNPTAALATPIAATMGELVNAMELIGDRASQGSRWSMSFPFDGNTMILKGGRGSVNAGTKRAEITFNTPFPDRQPNKPLVSVAYDSNNDVPTIVRTGTYPETPEAGEPAETDGLYIDFFEWDDVNKTWGDPTQTTYFTWFTFGY